MLREKLVSEIVKYFKDDYIQLFKKEDLEKEDPFLKEYTDIDYYNSKEYIEDINRYQNQFSFNVNGFTYLPETKSFLYCMGIEMDIVAEMRRTGENIEREYVCNPAHSEIFFDNGINIVDSIKVIEEETSIKLNLNLIKYEVVFDEKGKATLEKTNETSTANMLFDFNKLELVKNNFTIDLTTYFIDSCYSFWAVLSAFILYKFKDLGYNVLDKIKYLESEYISHNKNNKEYYFSTKSLDDIALLFYNNQYNIKDLCIKHILASNGNYKGLTRDLLRLSPNKLIEHFGLEVSPSLIKNMNKDILNLLYTKELTDLGFNKKEISILIANNAISYDVLNSRIFKTYINNLSKKQILRKLTQGSGTIQVITDIEEMLKAIGESFEINPNISLANLEREIISIYNNIKIESLTGKIFYNLPNIDYSKEEHCLYSNNGYELIIPLRMELLSVYGEKLENCIGTKGKNFLKSQNYIAVIKNNNSLVGAIRIDRNFEELLEAHSKFNKDLKNGARDFIIEFCKVNEMRYSHILSELNNKEDNMREAV